MAFRCDVREANPTGNRLASPLSCSPLQILSTECWEAKKPQDTIWYFLQNAQPGGEDYGIDLKAHCQ